jgi:hypothetical protein
MKLTDLWNFQIGQSKWAMLVCYRTPDGLCWAWCDLRDAANCRKGFSTEDEAHRDARANGYEVENGRPV